MTVPRLTSRAAVAAGLLAAAPARAAAQHDHGHHQGTVTPAPAAADRRAGPPTVSPMLHMRMTDLRAPAAGDSARAARLADAVRRGIARYRDVRAAERAGYKPIFVGDTAAGQVLHYTHLWNGVKETWRLDPKQPGSLLYEVQRDGSRRLVGAMYGAPDKATPDDLDRRVPLSYARWHLHTDLCVPKPIWDKAAWARTLDDGRPVFGPESPVATREACARAGGQFKPHMFGWMVHAMVVDNTRLSDVWNEADHGGHSMAAMAGAGAAQRTAPERSGAHRHGTP